MANFLLKFPNFRYHGNRGWCDTNFVCTPLLNFWTVLLHTTHWLALPIMAPTRSYPLAVAQLSLFANLSHNYPLPFQIFHRSSHLLSLCNFLIRNYQFSVSIVLHPRPLIPNRSLFSSMTSVLFCRLLQPLPMNLSSPVTSTFISIILQTLSPLSFCLFFLLTILVNTFTSLRMTKITFLIWS